MEAFAALADPTRRQIVDLLAAGERSVGDLARHFTVTQPAISQHLRALQKAGLVRIRQDAQRRMYSLEPDGFMRLDAWLLRYRKFWTDKIDALERGLTEETKT